MHKFPYLSDVLNDYTPLTSVPKRTLCIIIDSKIPLLQTLHFYFLPFIRKFINTFDFFVSDLFPDTRERIFLALSGSISFYI